VLDVIVLLKFCVLIVLASEFLQLLLAVVSDFVLLIGWILETRALLLKQAEAEDPWHIGLVVRRDSNIWGVL
jgi:hypothetical protein